MLSQLQRFLTTFKEASQLLQTDLNPEISNVIPTISGLKLACHVPGITDVDENDPDAQFALQVAGEPNDPEDEEDEPIEDLSVITDLKVLMYKALKKRFNFFDDPKTPLYKLAASLDKRWQARFGYQSEDEFIDGLNAFENPSAPDNVTGGSNQQENLGTYINLVL